MRTSHHRSVSVVMLLLLKYANDNYLLSPTLLTEKEGNGIILLFFSSLALLSTQVETFLHCNKEPEVFR